MRGLGIIRVYLGFLFLYMLFCFFGNVDFLYSAGIIVGLRAAPALGIAIAVLFFVAAAITGIPPVSAVYFLCGAVFDKGSAFALSIVGGGLYFALLYCMGAFSRGKSYPLILALSDGGKKGFFAAFVLRAIRLVPGGAAGIYMGRARLPFWGYLFGSLFGALPSTVISILIGAAWSGGSAAAVLGLSSFAMAMGALQMLFAKLFIK